VALVTKVLGSVLRAVREDEKFIHKAADECC
jgi:hypothetical protein